MLKNHLVIALRHLFGNKGYFFINTFGLSTGIACCLLIFLFVRQEWTFDAFHEKADRIYRVNVGGSGFEDNLYTSAITPLPLAAAFMEQYPGVEQTVRIRSARGAEVRVGNEVFREKHVLYSDPSIFNMFSFPLIEGDPGTVLNELNSVVISQSAAEKYFGTGSPLGRQLTILGEPFWVAGVAENTPVNSSIRFDFLIPFDKMFAIDNWTNQAIGNWNNSFSSTFVELSDPVMANMLEDQLPGFVETHFSQMGSPYLELQPITDMYLEQGVRFGLGTTSDPNRSYILICTALFVLFIACVNFMNLAFCRSSSRAREVGLRKVFGAQKIQIMKQFLGETAVLSCFALIFGVILAHLFLPVFNTLAGSSYVLDYLTNGSTIAALLVLTALVALASGSYPALILSRFDPVAVFRHQVRIGSPNLVIRGLMVVQFGLSALLVVSILVMTRQLDFVLSTDLGYKKENVIVIHMGPNSNSADVYKSRINSYENVILVSGASNTFGRGLGQSAYTDKDGNKLEAYMFTVDYDYVKTLELNLVSGRGFSREFGNDESGSCIINEAAARVMEWDDPLGRTLPHGYTVIGVLEDYHYQSMHQEIEPVILTMNPDSFGEGTLGGVNFLLVRVNGRNLPATLDLLRVAWMEIALESPFEYSFLDDDIALFYADEANLARIFTYSAVFALLIACLGVYGLVSLEVSRRTKEICIRKVMGAAVSDIMSLMSKQFVYLVLIASVLAWPAAWWLMNEWLADFAYRTEIGAALFVAAGLVVLATALLTVSVHTFRSAMLNPADTLRRD